MLTRVGLSPKALDTSWLPDGISDQVHETLTDTLRQYGRLVALSETELRELVQMVTGRRIPGPMSRKRWEVLLTHLRKTDRVTCVAASELASLAEAQSVQALVAAGHGNMAVIVLANPDADRLGVPNDRVLAAQQGVPLEIATIATWTGCSSIKLVKDGMVKNVLQHNESRDDFWTLRLRPIAEGARMITVIDRFMFSTLNRIHTGRVSLPSGADEHVVWLLRRLDEVVATGATVTLHAARRRNDGLAAADLAQLILTRWAPPTSGRLRRVAIELGKVANYGDYPHDRHIRFSTGVAIDVHAGFDRLQAATVTDPAGMKWGYNWDIEQISYLRHRESLAQAIPSARAVVLERMTS